MSPHVKGVLCIAIMCGIVVALALVVVLLLGCSECRPSTVRCQGDVLEICAGNETWAESEDCGEILDAENSPWTCCEETDAGEPECLPVEECQ